MTQGSAMQDRERLRHRPPRSLLFSPATSEHRMIKAMNSGADAVILDLEDSVAPAAKAEARQTVLRVLALPRPVPVIVRINAQDTEDYLEDLARVLPAAPDALMLPKCTGRADLAVLSSQLDVLEAAYRLPRNAIEIIPLVTETAGSLARLDYPNATGRLAGLGFAGEDLSASLGVEARDAGVMNPLLAHARQSVAFAAAAAGIAAIDTPFPDPANSEGLRTETREAVRLGYAGKMCIHPGQISGVHDAFTPEPERIAWSREVVEALEGNGVGVAVVGGRMVDIAHLRLARRLLDRAEGTGRDHGHDA